MSISSISSNKNSNIPQSASSMSITSINNSNIPQSATALSNSINKNNNTQSCTNNFVASNLNENLVIPSPIPTKKFFRTPLKIDSKSPAKLSIISKKLTTVSKYKKNTIKSKTTSACKQACKKFESKIKSEEIKLAGTIKSSLVNYLITIFIRRIIIWDKYLTFILPTI
jgi:hypothetical protein